MTHFLVFWPAHSVTVAHTQVFKPHMVEKEQEKRKEGGGREGGRERGKEKKGGREGKEGKRERGKEGKKEEMI